MSRLISFLKSVWRGIGPGGRLYKWLLDRSEALKNLTTAAALIGAGIWTFLVFNAELRRENAEAKLEKELREINRVSLALGLEIHPLVDPSSADPRCYFELLVHAENQGTKDLKLLDPFIAVSRVRGVDGLGVPEVPDSPIAATYVWRARGGAFNRKDRELVRAGDRPAISFLVRIEPRGLYQASFTAKLEQTPDDKDPFILTRYFAVTDRRQDGLCEVIPGTLVPRAE